MEHPAERRFRGGRLAMDVVIATTGPHVVLDNLDLFPPRPKPPSYQARFGHRRKELRGAGVEVPDHVQELPSGSQGLNGRCRHCATPTFVLTVLTAGSSGGAQRRSAPRDCSASEILS